MTLKELFLFGIHVIWNFVTCSSEENNEKVSSPNLLCLRDLYSVWQAKSAVLQNDTKLH